MIAEERRAILVQKLKTTGFIEVSGLASEIGVSGITLRRDLAEMEAEGLILRVRGGAVPRDQGVTLELPYDVKKNQSLSEKKRIGEKAAGFVCAGDTIILDAGSTTYALAMQLISQKHIVVVTNDLHIMVKLASNPEITLISTGGVVRSNVFSLQGHQVESFLSDLTVDKTFLGADAIHPDGTISNVNLDEAQIKRAMVKAAREVYLLADSSKFEKKGFAKVCHISEIHTLVVDRGLPPEKLDEIAAMGVKIVLT